MMAKPLQTPFTNMVARRPASVCSMLIQAKLMPMKSTDSVMIHWWSTNTSMWPAEATRMAVKAWISLCWFGLVRQVWVGQAE